MALPDRPQNFSELLSHNTSETRTPLEIEWTRQSQNYINLGFHTEIGLSEEEYLDTLPHFQPNSQENKKIDLIHPLLVDPRVNICKQIELAGIMISENSKKTYNEWAFETKDMYGYHSLDRSDMRVSRSIEIRNNPPFKPYVTWAQGGLKYSRRDSYYVSEEITKKFYDYKSCEMIGTIHEGVAFVIQHPLVLQNNELVVLGTDIGMDFEIPVFARFKDGTIYLGFFGKTPPKTEYRGILTTSWPFQFKQY